MIATEINKKILGDLNLLLAELKKQITAADKEEAKLRKEYKDANAACIKAKSVDDEKKKASEKLQIELIQSKDLKPKNLQALQNKSHTAEKDAKKAESEYKVAVDKQNKTREAYYKLLAALMDSLEVVDRKRLNTMQNIFNSYLSLEEKMSVAIDDGIEKMTKSFEKLDPSLDITNFINKTKNPSYKRPAVETFEPVDSKIPKELTISKYSVDINTKSLKFGSSLDKRESHVEQKPSVKESSGETVQETSENDHSATDFSLLTTVIKKVVSNYDYEPQAPEELKLVSGQTINVLQIIEDGWWIGEVEGRKGYFPSNFITEPENGAPLESVPIEETKNESVPETLTLLGKCKALYPYEPQDPAELKLNEGDMIDVYQKNEDGWWYGEVSGTGERGLFPSNYVEQ